MGKDGNGYAAVIGTYVFFPLGFGYEIPELYEIIIVNESDDGKETTME